MNIRTVAILSILFAVGSFALLLYWMVDGNTRDKERQALMRFAGCAYAMVEVPTKDIAEAWTPAEHLEQCRVSAGIAFEHVTPTQHKLYFR
jgi:hypothetical protein